MTSSNGPGCSSCGAGGVNATLGYDQFLNLTSFADALGIVTNMTYDGKGNVLTRKEAVGTPVERTWTFTWHPTFNFPATVTFPSVGTCSNPNKVITNTYNGATGDRLTEQVTGCAGAATFSRTTSYTYDSHGQVATINGPRTDVTDVTTYVYYADGDSDINLRARLERVTNALGHETTFADYDLFGNVGTETDANNVETTYLYDEKERVTEARIHGAMPADDIVTEQAWDLEGNLDLVRLPNCVEAGLGCAFSLDYTHDTVNRLTEVLDPLGNKVVYTYDTEGNRTREEYRDASAVVQSFTNFGHDDFNRLEYTYFTNIVPEDPASVFFKFTYRDDGLREEEQDPEGHVVTFDYDELKRLTTVTETAGLDTLTTMYEHDVQDNLSGVTDPNGFLTTFVSHDMGWELRSVAPDTGTTVSTYDPAGNLESTTDANGTTSTRDYDAVNRLVAVSYPDTNLNVAHTYDSIAVAFGIGRRTGMTDSSGSAIYRYERRGLLTQEEKTLGSSTWTTQYTYDKTGNTTQILYPTDDPGQRQGEVGYSYDAADRVSGITAMINGSPTAVASSFSYEPFGPRTSLTFGNGLVDARTHGTRYQLGDWSVGSQVDYTYVFDDDLNLTARTDNLNAASNRVFGHDEVHRLTTASGPWGAGTGCPGGLTYTYDENGNRLCKGEQAPATTYAYVPNTNRLDASTGGEPASYTYDDNGSATADGTHTYEYNDANRLSAVDAGAVSTYTYDGDGRRVIRTAATTTYFFYDPSGGLLSEVTPDPKAGKDYIHLLGAPLARVDWTTEQALGGDVLRVDKDSPNVRLDWSLFPAASNDYVVRRKQVVDPNDKTFNGSTPLAIISDPTQVFDDPVLNDGNDYNYRVFRLAVGDTLYFYHSDHIDTPIAMTDGAATVVWRVEALPFGGILDLPVDDVENNLRFPGQYADAATPFYYNLNRWYESRSGRYSRADPLGLLGGPHPYLYADANPVVFVDPTGERARVCCTPVPLAPGPAKHCFVHEEDDQTGQDRTYGLQSVKGKGCRYRDDGFDLEALPKRDPRTQCGPWNEECKTGQCLGQAFESYPSPSDYQLLRGPNSNSFARTLSESCGLTPPTFVGSWWQTPGWNKQGRPAKNRRFRCPPVR